MKIATYNVNGINGRLPVLLRWLEEDTPDDVVCLQELKAHGASFSGRVMGPSGTGRRAGTTKRSAPAARRPLVWAHAIAFALFFS